MNSRPVLVAGGGLGGLATALTLHQIGVPCLVLESVREMRPLGVGINLQPNAVRELCDLGITESDLDGVGLPAKEWALVGLNGNDVYSEPRGRLAGYRWSQYAVHRGRLQISFNLAYGSAMASIGLTIPAIAIASIWLDGPLVLGLGATQIGLLFLTALVSCLTLLPGRATLQEGGVHLI